MVSVWKAFTKGLLNEISQIKKTHTPELFWPLSLNPSLWKWIGRNAHGRCAKNTLSLKKRLEIPLHHWTLGRETLLVPWLCRALGLRVMTENSALSRHLPRRHWKMTRCGGMHSALGFKRPGVQPEACRALTLWPPESSWISLGSNFLTCGMPVKGLGQTVRSPPALMFYNLSCG